MLRVGSYCENNSDDDDDFDDALALANASANPGAVDNPPASAFASASAAGSVADYPAPFVSPRKRRKTYREVTESASPDTAATAATAAGASTTPRNGSSSNNSPSTAAASPSKVLRSSASSTKRSLFQTTRSTSQKIANFPASPNKQTARKQPSSSSFSSRRARPSSAFDGIDPANSSPWHTLPYFILQDIFFHAAHLHPARSSPGFDGCSVSKWLLGTCCVCKSWCEPAIDVLYYSPQLFPERRYNRLLKLLLQQQDQLLFNYRNKVKKLEIRLPQYSLRKWCLLELLSCVPNLRHLRIYETDNEQEMKRYEPAARWTDWDALFDVLEANNVHLRSWECNWRLMCPSKHQANLPDSIATSHTRPPFSTLKRLRLQSFPNDMNYLGLAPDTEENNALALYGETPTLNAMGNALHLLSSTLKEVEVRNSSLLDDRLLVKLPQELRSLTLHDCPMLTSWNLTSFLASHGSRLEELYLTHNDNEELTMSFTSNLASLCPNLRVFKMGFNFSSSAPQHHHRYFNGFGNDQQPIYVDDDDDDHDGAGDTTMMSTGWGPDWPSSLVHLDLERPGRWTESTSVAVFNSLINHAEKLRNLRTIRLSVILMIEWRDRAAFRERWTRRLNKAFLRRAGPPPGGVVDTGADVAAGAGRGGKRRRVDGFGATRPSLAGETKASFKLSLPSEEPEAGTRHSSRIASQTRKTMYREDSDTDLDRSSSPSPPPSPSPSKTRQNKPTKSKNNDSKKHDEDDDDAVPYIQGMCNVVEVIVDNLRPANVLMTAENFEDSEISGDEDWERDQDFDETYAW